MANSIRRYMGPRRSTSSGIVVIMVCIGFSMLLFAGCGQQKEPPAPPPTVEVTQVIQKDVPVYFEWVGSADGYINAAIRAQVQGYLVKQNYLEGDVVKKGQVLFEIDPRPFQAALDQAKADLAQSEARWWTAKANLGRIRPLAKENAVSQKDLDDAIGNEQSTAATVQANKAAVEKAQLNLEFTKITSLINGIAGIAKAQIGDLVGPGSIDELTTVSTVDPIKVYINISEQEYLHASEVKDVDMEKVALDLILTDGTTYPHKGKFFLADRQVDVKTGTLKVGCIFRNPKNLIRPGQFTKVRALLGTRENALLVPQRAVSELQGSYQVAVVGQDNKVDIRPVKTAERVGILWVILEGLKPGERVIAEGLQKVKQGMTVHVKPFQGEVPAKAQVSPTAEKKPEVPAKTGKKPEAAPKADKR
jgi:membrane fusion protein (multidrug efflux system)